MRPLMNMVHSSSFLGCFLLIIWYSYCVGATSRSDRSPCHDPRILREPPTLRSDQLTVLINGFSESRIPLLCSIASSYSGSPIVASVLILWGNPSTPGHVVSEMSRNLTSFGAATISIIRQSSTSLNSRFLPREAINTRAVLVCDDDVEVDAKTLEFTFRIWGTKPDHLIGLFGRSHDIDLSRKQWIYTVHPNRYSIVLTKFMMMKRDYLFKYSCLGGEVMAKMRRVVDEMQNCEDLLMNFVVADEINEGPILVGAERAIRDYGDSRNEGKTREDVREVGLSSRRGEHRKRRGLCIREFHKVMGRMPLRYSYGKLINSVSEQALCDKGGGRLVYCDQFD